uniref:Uncharacterized protein n=1 Tax=Lactuca sativa TaxID=4236 RepID=A0A9R1WSA4_LACSA|nr:hypothetical protein LSAT_V11C900456630 [Lactuca sativa]
MNWREKRKRTSQHDELGSQKLTRAQRKRLRTKKLKEAASHRRQIIGLELPPTVDDQNCMICSSLFLYPNLTLDQSYMYIDII